MKKLKWTNLNTKGRVLAVHFEILMGTNKVTATFGSLVVGHIYSQDLIPNCSNDAESLSRAFEYIS